MSTALAQQQQLKTPTSGRIGTMTSDQQQVLTQFWRMLLDLFADSAPAIQSTKNSKNFLSRKKTTDATANDSSSSDKYNEFRELASALELYSLSELRQAWWRLNSFDDPDSIMLRFLRARKWDVNKALAMLVSTLKWSLQSDIESIISDGESGLQQYFEEKRMKGFDLQLTSGKSFLHGFDKEGRPICYINVRYHKKDDQSLEILQKFTLWTMETSRLMVIPPVETACLVFNMDGFSLSNVDYQYINFMIKCFEAYYPESLGVCLVHRAPWVFSVVWKVISPLIDPVVAAKIKFTNDSKELLEYISSDTLIASLGGNNKWEYKYVPPKPNENARMADTKTKENKLKIRRDLESKFEESTRKWLADPSPTNIKERQELKKKLREAQIQLDPYIRARTLYHRIGVIKDDGGCDWKVLE
ncbi:3193_t:CDS:2 [Paraglomus occultum]|uniref:3193_t:CDS:1 n=1 Tax=Paraglomus occultum TaxID=144539 RepID=A0A9N8ZUB0_9GLOM|nr:3193_t:CDS:2 [Paraglomus occultum]